LYSGGSVEVPQRRQSTRSGRFSFPEEVTGPARSTAIRWIPRGDLNAAIEVVRVHYSTDRHLLKEVAQI
jgi:hypothetical protein